MQLSGLELQNTVAHTASGTVHEATHKLLGRKVLVKLMPDEAKQHQEVRKRFLREIRLAGQLSHPHLISALHAGEEDGSLFLVLEHVEGIDLARQVKEQGRLSPREAIGFVLQATKGLGYLHEQGVFHRNVKPANLLVDRFGHLRVTNLTAAGVDKDAEIDMADTEGLTRPRQMIGTADYMAPEQAFDAHIADARSDVYGLGCTLHYLLLAEPPYPEADSKRRVAAHTQRPIPSLRAKRLDVPAELDAVFQKMLAKMPADRYQTMQEVEAALLAVQQALAVVPPVKKDWMAMGVVAVITAVITVLIVTSVMQIGVVNFFYPVK